MRRIPIALAIFVFSCTKPEAPVHSIASAPSSSAPEIAPIVSASVTPPPLIELPSIATSAPGPAYVLVDHSGVLQITDSGALTVFPVPRDRSSLFTEIHTSPSGDLWLSDFHGIRVYSLQGATTSPRTVKDGPLYEKLVIRSNKDVWGVSSDIEWNVVHYDGSSWKNVRKRSQFSGQYEDNKFSGLAVTSDGIWISSWNGVWRGVNDQWEKVNLPEGSSFGPDLLVYHDQLIVISPGAAFLRQKETWKKLAWPDKVLLRWAISDLGFVAAPLEKKPRIAIFPVEGNSGFIESDVISGQDIRALDIDESGRIWVGTDQALAVLDRRGHLLMQWPAGTLDGLTGSILDIAVVASGPATLPTPKVAKKWDVRGQFVTYKQSKPLPGATLALCSSGSFNCNQDPQAQHAATNARGEFRFPSISEGEFWIYVSPPPGTQDCETPFTLTAELFMPARDCHDNPSAPGVCDLGTLKTCLPFEMPPPPPRGK